ncbi:uncharacterized protein PAC_19740 [Phialocephala subalpina]|uniref:Alpha/beta hydrolase fold-3 domain-containing protein n=1 Tax=Phialocephala subalpina TaxID=576137 RepID=A0A1L7XXV3_9HELO|nr:uncharacterized protein PAC_19740 [Phialocephala subalpina]
MEAPSLTTEETYKKVLAAEGIPSDVEELDGCSLLWLGARTAKSIIVYMCGGGLVTHAYESHIQFLLNGWKIMKANNQDVSIAFLAYGLCPTTLYPAQIRQVVSTTQHLLKTRPAESISFSGDSIGGMLILALLLHPTHPHPSVPPLSLLPGSRFNSTFLISPGSPIATSTPSMLENEGKDIFTLAGLQQTHDIVNASLEPGIDFPNPWILASSVEGKWWKGLPVGEVVVTAGGNELLRDDILAVGERIKRYHDREVVVFCGEGEVHCGPLVDLLMGVEEDKACTKLWKQWFQDFKAYRIRT